MIIISAYLYYERKEPSDMETLMMVDNYLVGKLSDFHCLSSNIAIRIEQNTK